MPRSSLRSFLTGLAATSLLAAVTLIPSSSSASAAAAAKPVTALGFGSKGWRYDQVPAGGGDPAFIRPVFNDSGWSVGQAGFGTTGGTSIACSWNNAAHVKTRWATNTDLLVRHHLAIPYGAKAVHIEGDVDNDADVYMNGHLLQHVADGHCGAGGINVYVPAGDLKPDNVLAIRGHDYGDATFLDVQVTYVRPKTVTKLTLAALGDSYSSGEGTNDYDKGSGACHRGRDAWPRLLADSNPYVKMQAHLACSGATTAALWSAFKKQRAQLKALSALRPRPSLITMTMGGNDVGFADVLEDCFLSYLNNCATDGTLQKASTAINSEQGVLAADYRDLKNADPSATVVIAGYPRIFPSLQKDVTCDWLTGAKRAELNKLTGQLNTVIRAAAAKAEVHYVDITNALKGHEVCTKHPWVYEIGLTGKFVQEDGHPTFFGQHAISELVRRYINRWF